MSIFHIPIIGIKSKIYVLNIVFIYFTYPQWLLKMNNHTVMQNKTKNKPLSDNINNIFVQIKEILQ